MKIVFLPSTVGDLRWYKRYYQRVFPEGKSKADKQFQKTKQTLKDNPRIGHDSEMYSSAREYHIPRVPFTVIYQVHEDEIRVIRVRDQRSGTGNPL